MSKEFPKTDALIQRYWDEDARLRASGRLYAWVEDGFCQCTSESIIQDSRDPDEMRAFLMIGVLIDEIMYAHFGSLYNSFHQRFRYPKLHNHGTSGMMHPHWFRFTAEKKNKEINWKSVETVSDNLLKELDQWFVSSGNKDEWNSFMQWWKSESYFLKKPE